MVKNIYLILIMIFFSSCYLIGYEELAGERTDYFGNALRLDGYYYREFKSDEEIAKEIYFLNRNGVIVGGSSVSESGLDQFLEEVKTGVYYERVKKDKTSWGLFFIDDQKKSIHIETWGVSSGGAAPVFNQYGEIIDSTSYRINRSVKRSNGKISERKTIFSFEEFDFKPDSTSSFIK